MFSIEVIASLENSLFKAMLGPQTAEITSHSFDDLHEYQATGSFASSRMSCDFLLNSGLVANVEPEKLRKKIDAAIREFDIFLL